MQRATVGLSLIVTLAACGDAGNASETGTTDAPPGTGDTPTTGTVVPTTGGATDDPTPTASGDASAAETGPPADTARLLLHFGADISPTVQARVQAHIEAVATLPVVVVAADATIAPQPPDSRVLTFGDTPSTRQIIPTDELAAAGSEGFILRSGEVAGAPAIAADGNAIAPDPFGHASLGDGFATYALLEQLGFDFLHPLAPTRPPELTWPDAIDRTEAPYWPIRGLQLHTMHPLELTDLLNGWGPKGPDDAAGWEAMLPEWDSYLEWALANRQNRTHWLLLSSDSWQAFADGSERQARLSTLVDHAHEFGVWIGIDTPIVLQQQHTWRLIPKTGELADEVEQLEARVDYLIAAGFDYLATESGTTEFTSPDDQRMVAWMDALAKHLDEAHDGRRPLIKIHASTGQTVDHYVDPDTMEPLNFNFLPHYADPRLGVMPHTVQHYGLTDLAPTYGNTDFGYMREFLQEEAGARQVVWHPETAYWVSFDVDVPLFLPIYAERRLSDLRLLAGDELAGKMGRGEHAGARMDGQITFSSGWEWSYWLQEVVTARAAWDPRMDLVDPEAAYRAALAPVVRPFGPVADKVRDLLVATTQAQQALLIDGEINGKPPKDITRRSGQAYLQGSETWDDVSDLAESIPGLTFTRTQPDSVSLLEMRNPVHPPPGYSKELEPLLAAMETKFSAIADQLELLQPQVPAHARPLYDDIVDSARITALRAVQVHGLYDYVDAIYEDDKEAWRLMRLQVARDALDAALLVAKQREASYRVPADRIAGWRNNPTAYEYGYLWTVRDLYYWWRDEAIAVEAPINPCYLNITNPVDVGFGEGTIFTATEILSTVGEKVPGLGSLVGCLSAPDSEPTLPPPGLRDKP